VVPGAHQGVCPVDRCVQPGVWWHHTRRRPIRERQLRVATNAWMNLQGRLKLRTASREPETRSWLGFLEPAPADEAACQRDEGVVEFEASFPAHGEAFELVEQGEGLLHDVAELAQALDVRGAPAGDHRHDASASKLAAHSPRVVRLVAQDRFGAPPRVSRPSGHRLDAVNQGEGLGDVVDVRCGGDDVQWGAASVADQVVFAARLAPVDR
jgi:hypothetical protein